MCQPVSMGVHVAGRTHRMGCIAEQCHLPHHPSRQHLHVHQIPQPQPVVIRHLEYRPWCGSKLRTHDGHHVLFACFVRPGGVSRSRCALGRDGEHAVHDLVCKHSVDAELGSGDSPRCSGTGT